MEVLITGGAGFLGIKLTRALLARGTHGGVHLGPGVVAGDQHQMRGRGRGGR